MPDKAWQRQWAIFNDAVELHDDQRAAFLDRECDGDEKLRREVEALLRGHDQSTGVLDVPPGYAAPDGESAEALIGTPIGSFEIVETIGEGGMGTVYAALQREPVERRVALKVIKPGMDTREVVARFESERQALALMNHPAIAAVIDCGATAAGRPYFAMELVDGSPITDHCSGRDLSVRQRVELFLRVCEAVQHAHRKGIVHRDLKPSNVLVTETEGGALPKVIDFGVAKAIAAGPAERTVETQAGRLIGTPEYMSPEQAEMSPDIDTQTDVYALGVMLYELLTGVLPFDFAGKSHSEINSLVRKQEPPAPSRRVSAADETSPVGRHEPPVDAAALRRLLRGDLDWIVMRALEKERSRRYGSVAELAADLRHYLNNEPVSAGPPSTAYRLRKLVARHRAAALGVAAVAVTLLAGIVATSWFAIGEARQRAAAVVAQADAEAARDQAQQDADRAEAMNDLLFDILEAPDPTQPSLTPGEAREVKVVEVLARAAASADETFADEPHLAANVHAVVGRMFLRLGLFQEAEAELRQAHEARRDRLGDEHPETLAAGHNLATAIDNAGRPDEAIEAFERILEARRRVLGAVHVETLMTTINLANTLAERGRYDEAEPLFRDALESAGTALGENDDRTLGAVTGLAFVLNRQGDAAAAEPLYQRVLDGRLATLGPDHPGTLSSMNNLAATLQTLERFDEAETMYGDMIEGYSRVLGPEHASTLNALSNYGSLLVRQEKLAEAEDVFRRVSEAEERTLGPTHPLTIIATNNLARMVTEQGRFEEAAVVYESLMPRAHEIFPADHINLALFRGGYGSLLTQLERFDEAEVELLAAFEVVSATLGEQNARSISQARRLVELYEAWGKPADAARYRALLPGGG